MKKLCLITLLSALTIGAAGTFVACDNYKDEIESLKQQVDKRATKEDLQSQVSTLQTALTAAQGAADAAKQAAQAADAKAQAAQTAADAAKAAADKADANAKTAAATAKSEAIEAAIAQVEDMLEKYATAEDMKAAQDELTAVKSQIAGIEETLATLPGDVDSLMKATAALELRLKTVEEYKALIDANTEEIEKINEAIATINETLGTLGGDEGLADKVAEIDEMLKGINVNLLDSVATMVTSVELFYSYNYWEESLSGVSLGFTSAVEQDNTFFKKVTGMEEDYMKEVKEGPITFTKGNEYYPERSFIVRVSPTNAVLTKEMITLVNSKGENTVADLIDLDVERFNDLLTTRAAGGNGLWKVTARMKGKYEEKAFDAATRSNGLQVLFAVKVNNTPDSTGTVDRGVVSSYDISLRWHKFSPETELDFYLDDKTNVGDVNNRYYGGEKIGDYYYIQSQSFFKDEKYRFTYKEKAWNRGVAVEATGNNATDRVRDNRNNRKAYAAAQGKPIKITIPTPGYDQNRIGEYLPNENIRAMYVTLDFKANAVESAPSEWESWNSYEYTGLNEVVYGATTTITIDSDEAIDDFIGFRVYAVNHDGSLVDPDGKAFYVQIGNEEDPKDWNGLATIVTPKANPESDKSNDKVFNAQNTLSDRQDVALTNEKGAETFTWDVYELDQWGNYDPEDSLATDVFHAYFVDAAGQPVFNTANATGFKDLNLERVAKMYTKPAVAWNQLTDNGTYLGILTVTNKSGRKLAVLTVTMTKVMPTSDPAGVFAFKTGIVENNVWNAYLTPWDGNGNEKWDVSGGYAKGGYYNIKNYVELNKLSNADQTAYYRDMRFSGTKAGTNAAGQHAHVEFSLAKDYNEKGWLEVIGESHTAGNATHYFIDNTTSHNIYVVYNYGEITSATKATAAPGDDKAGTYVVNTGDEESPTFEYYVKVKRPETIVYCNIYDEDAYDWGWVTRAQATTKGMGFNVDFWGAKRQTDDPNGKYKKGDYVNDLEKAVTKNSSTTFGTDGTVDLAYICGVSKVYPTIDEANGKLYGDAGQKSLTLPDAATAVRLCVKGTSKDNGYYEAKEIKEGKVTLTFKGNAGDPGPASDVACDLVITCKDMYRNPFDIKVPYTIKKK